jgi:hypothetical protein
MHSPYHNSAFEEALKPRRLDLGDIARPSEMHSPSHDSAFEEAHFPIHSFAFVVRSSGEWTYAIFANRAVLKDQDAIRFVMDKNGSTKILKKRHWTRYIRLVRDDNDGHSKLIGDTWLQHREKLMTQDHLDRHFSFNMSVRTKDW